MNSNQILSCATAIQRQLLLVCTGVCVYDTNLFGWPLPLNREGFMEIQVARQPVTGIELITCTGAPKPVTLGIHARPCAFDHLQKSVPTVCNLDNSSPGDVACWMSASSPAATAARRGHTPTWWSSFVKPAAHTYLTLPR